MRDMPSPETRHAIANRLRTSEGHLRAIVDMLETSAPCDDVLHQLDAVESALHIAACALRYSQFARSIEIIRHDLNAERRLAELEQIAALYKVCLRPSQILFKSGGKNIDYE